MIGVGLIPLEVWLVHRFERDVAWLQIRMGVWLSLKLGWGCCFPSN